MVLLIDMAEAAIESLLVFISTLFNTSMRGLDCLFIFPSDSGIWSYNLSCALAVELSRSILP